MSPSALDLLARFAEPASRTGAAADLARWVGAETVLVFLRDAEVDALVPASGFPQTVAGGPRWRAFLRALAGADAGVHRAEVDRPRAALVGAVAHVTADGTALVLLGGAPDEARVGEVLVGLPLLGALVRAEQRARIARGEAMVARSTSQHARDLAFALDAARGDLERALAEAARLNDELKEAARRKDDFLAMLGHELRNPMAAIAGAAEVMRLSIGDSVRTERARVIIDRQAEQLARIVEDLLDVARVSRGKIVLRLEPVSVADVARRALDGTRALVESRRHDVVVEAREDVFAKADRARLEQIVANLVTNAAKYTEPGGRISVVIEREGDDAVVRVSDDGVGIAPEMLAAVFEPFVQVSASIDRGGGGLGIGLTLVKSLVELHGGRVDATSEPGRGSVFSVRLPAIAAPLAQPHVDVPLRVEGTTSKRVLIVDDNADSGEMLLELTTAWGHTAIHVTDGAEALAAAASFRPDIVFLDIGLPGMDGYELAARLRASPITRDARIIAVSGYGQEGDRRRSRAAGCDEHFVKPVDVVKLATAIAG